MLSCWNSWNYLRVRGEYVFAGDLIEGYTELPPRARRIRLLRHLERDCTGTTSACAENTAVEAALIAEYGNYLRVRGEYARLPLTPPSIWELPPRARRIRIVHMGFGGFGGTTSACAENTCDHISDQHFRRNYLRVRGEYKGFP